MNKQKKSQQKAEYERYRNLLAKETKGTITFAERNILKIIRKKKSHA